jgi:hypothetical protein
MQISGPASPQTLRFDLSTESQRRNLLARLTQGQTLEARVLQRLDDGRWTVRFMGHNLVAESFHSFLPGQIVHARVQSLGPPLILSLTGDSGSESASIARALQDLGLIDDGLNRAIVKGLIGKGLSVDLQSVQDLRDLYIALGFSPDADNLEELDELVAKILFLQGQGLPVTPDALSSYLSRLPAGVLGGLIEGLAELLRSFRTVPAPQTLNGLLENLRPAELTGDGLRDFLSGLGIDLEGRLASWVASGGRGVPGGLDPNLKLLLLRLQTELTGLDATALAAPHRSLLSTLQDRISEMLIFLDTLQATNLPSPDRQALHLQIPFILDGSVRTADLEITPESQVQSSRIDPENVSLTLSVDLTGLGPVKIHLSVLQGQASCNIHVADQQRSEFLQTMTSELEQSLERCGYTGARIACRTSEDTPGDRAEGPPTIGLDLRV